MCRPLAAVFIVVVAMFNARAQKATQPYSWQHLPQAKLPVFKKDTFNITRYGASADGVTLNTEPINKAIMAY